MTNLLSRRAALAGSTAALLGLSLRSPSALAAEARGGMRFGLVTYLWGKDLTLEELLAVSEKTGVAGLELRTEHKHGVEPSLSPQQRRDVRKRFADRPVELVGYGSNCEYHSPDPAKLKANIEQTKKYIQLMHDCGGSGVKVKPNTLPADVPHEKTIEQIGRSLNEVAEHGQKYGQKIRVEVHGKGTSDLPVMRDIFQVADHKNVFVCWNCNQQDLEGKGLEANFRMVQDRLGDTVHIRELNGEGYPYPQLMKLFKEIDYQGWILLEARTKPADLTAALNEQRTILERLTRG